MLKYFLALAVVPFAASFARGQNSTDALTPIYTANLKSTTNTSIAIQFNKSQVEVPGDSSNSWAYSIYIRASNPKFKGTEKIRAVFMNICSYGITGKVNRSYIRQVDLRAVAGTRQFFAPLDQALGKPEHVSIESIQKTGVNYSCSQEIALVVDGVWQKDPIMPGLSNFKFRM